MPKMDGVLAELKTYTDKGDCIGSEIVFRPTCEWYLPDLNDYLGQTKYSDLGAVIDEFGVDVAEKVIEGEIVPVVRDLPEKQERYRLVACPGEPKEYERIRSSIRYPLPGSKDALIVKR